MIGNPAGSPDCSYAILRTSVSTNKVRSIVCVAANRGVARPKVNWPAAIPQRFKKCRRLCPLDISLISTRDDVPRPDPPVSDETVHDIRVCMSELLCDVGRI